MLWEAGQELGITDAGYYAINSLRCEKGYRVWGSDITSDINPFEAGLGFCVSLTGKKGDFIGRKALEKVFSVIMTTQIFRSKKTVPRRNWRVSRLITLSHRLQETNLLQKMAKSLVLQQGSMHCATLTFSAGFGFTIGKHIAFGYVPAILLEPNQSLDFEIEVYGKKYQARRQSPLLQSLYDPERSKILS